jgi:purine-binding chemotaxis protein CheW
MDMDYPGVDDLPTLTPSRPTRPWCLFQCGQAGFAIALESVAEVVEVERLVRLPHSPPRVLGLCALRREVLPVIGMSDPGAEPDPAASTARVLVMILRTARGTWAVRIDPEGTAVAEESLDDPVPTGAAGGPVSFGTVSRGGASYAVIDPEATWLDVRQRAEDWYCNQMGRDTAARVHATQAATRTV